LAADPLPLRWTVVLWDGERVTVVLERRTERMWAAVEVDANGHRGTSHLGPTAEDALSVALGAFARAPYRSAYPGGQDPVALEREACAEIATSAVNGGWAAHIIRARGAPRG
jgi:hypothetical protein